jgi:hypothetical protein
MEGTINLIAYQMAEVKADVAGVQSDLVHVKGRVSAVELVQAQSSGVSASWKSWIPIIIAALALGGAFWFGG